MGGNNAMPGMSEVVMVTKTWNVRLPFSNVVRNISFQTPMCDIKRVSIFLSHANAFREPHLRVQCRKIGESQNVQKKTSRQTDSPESRSYSCCSCSLIQRMKVSSSGSSNCCDDGPPGEMAKSRGETVEISGWLRVLSVCGLCWFCCCCLWRC